MLKITLILFVSIYFLRQSALGAESVQFKLINGIFSYDSDYLSGTSTSILSPSISYQKDFTNKHQLGIGLDVFFSLSTQSVALYGLDVSYRYFISGDSSSVILRAAKDTVEYKSSVAYFLGADFKRYSYYLGSNKVDETRFDQTGDFFNLDVVIGGTYSRSLKSRYVLEISKTLSAFASSDDRVKFTGLYMSLGFIKDFD